MAVMSYEVGALLAIEDRAGPVLTSLSEQFAKLDGLIQGAQERLETLGKDPLGGRKINRGLQRNGDASRALQSCAAHLRAGYRRSRQ